MQTQPPESWPAGAYELARKMWEDGEVPTAITAKCRITRDQLYKVRRRHGWTARQRRALRMDTSALDMTAMEADWHGGVSIHAMGRRYHMNDRKVVALAEEHGWPARDDMREPLVAGHPMMWAMICQGTILQGAAFIR